MGSRSPANTNWCRPRALAACLFQDTNRTCSLLLSFLSRGPSSSRCSLVKPAGTGQERFLWARHPPQ